MEASFSGGAITSDGGAVLLRQADRMPGLTDRAAQALTDTRRKASCRHSLLTMIRQRVYALALGYEDLNEHEELRSDPALQTAVDADGPLAGASTPCAPIEPARARVTSRTTPCRAATSAEPKRHRYSPSRRLESACARPSNRQPTASARNASMSDNAPLPAASDAIRLHSISAFEAPRRRRFNPYPGIRSVWGGKPDALEFPLPCCGAGL